jgi:hypothetical protein
MAGCAAGFDQLAALLAVQVVALRAAAGVVHEKRK